MIKLIRTSVFILALICFLPLHAGGQKIGLEDLISILEYNESLIRNIDVKADFYDFRRMSLESPRYVENHRRLERTRYVYDNIGRTRLEQEDLRQLEEGKYADQGSVSTMTYDNEKGMFIGAGAPGERIVTIYPDDKVGSIRKPTDYLSARGWPLSKLLREAQKSENKPLLKYQEGGMLEVTVDLQGNLSGTKNFHLDPSQKYFLTRAETHRKGLLVEFYTVIPVAVGDEILLPGEVLHQSFSYPGGEKTLEYETRMVLREFSVNMENLDDSLFEEKIHDGDYLRDTRVPIPVSRYVGSGHIDRELLHRISDDLKNMIVLDTATADTAQSTETSRDSDNSLKSISSEESAEAQRAPFTIIWRVLGFGVFMGIALLLVFRIRARSGQKEKKRGRSTNL